MSEIQKIKCPYCGELTSIDKDSCEVCNCPLEKESNPKIGTTTTPQVKKAEENAPVKAAQPTPAPTQKPAPANNTKKEVEDFFGESQKVCLACGGKIPQESKYCPLCGQQTDKNLSQPVAKPASPKQPAPVKKGKQPWETFALVGFILSFVYPVVSIVFCALARKHQLSPGRQTLAKSGLIISIISCAYVAVSITLSLFFLIVCFCLLPLAM